MVLGIGRATAVTQLDIWTISNQLKVEPAVIDGIGITESNNAGWFPNGQLKILPEPHKFYEYLPLKKKPAALKQGLATRSYEETKASGHYKRMTNGPGPRYALLEKWIAYDEKAAYMAISSGSFQIMGFNYETCGFSDAKAMFQAFCDSEASHLKAFVAFITAQNGGLGALRKKDYDTIEKLYNGGGQNGAYAKLMRENVAKAQKGRWANYHPSDAVMVTPSKSEPIKEVKLGEISQEAEAIQARLIVWGYSIQADGNFGPKSVEALKAFQTDKGLTASGKVDQKTRLALFEAPKIKEQLKIEQDILPVVVTETKQTQIPVVPQQARKPFWKSWNVGGVLTIVGGWLTSLVGGLEPWMKFVLILIGIVIAILLIWQRQKLFNEAKAIISNVQDFNDSTASTVVDTAVEKNS